MKCSRCVKLGCVKLGSANFSVTQRDIPVPASPLPRQLRFMHLILWNASSGNSAVLEDWHMEETMPSAIHAVPPHSTFWNIFWVTAASETAASQSWLFKHYPLERVCAFCIYSHMHKSSAWVINSCCNRATLSDKALGTVTGMEKDWE